MGGDWCQLLGKIMFLYIEILFNILCMYLMYVICYMIHKLVAMLGFVSFVWEALLSGGFA